MGDLPHFERAEIVGASLAGASVTKMATILGASRAIVSKVMSEYTNPWEDNISKQEQWGKNQQ
jgi:predicted transcriptional regulator